MHNGCLSQDWNKRSPVDTFTPGDNKTDRIADSDIFIHISIIKNLNTIDVQFLDEKYAGEFLAVVGGPTHKDG